MSIKTLHLTAAACSPFRVQAPRAAAAGELGVREGNGVERMEIRPGKGVGQLLFGLTEPELVRTLGPPDKRYRTESEALRLQYFGPRLEFSIEPDNGHRFAWVEVHSPDAILFGRQVIGEPIAAILSLVTEALGEKPEYEDYGSLETYFYHRNWVKLQVEFGRVVAVNCGVLYDEADEPLWPPAQPAAAGVG